jgi:predicted polyphosphate/ATP-dependent NAD kinase
MQALRVIFGSAVFAFSARAAAEMADAFIAGTSTLEEEVLDIDEKAFRENRLASKLYGYLPVPAVKKHLQGGKEYSNTGITAAASKQEIARSISENMDRDTEILKMEVRC